MIHQLKLIGSLFLLFPAILCFSQTHSGTPPSDTTLVRQMLEHAYQLTDSALYEQALDIAEQAVQRNASSSRVLDEEAAGLAELIGKKCFAQRNFERTRRGFALAADCFNRCCGEITADRARNINNMGIALRYLGQFRDALKAFQQGLDIRQTLSGGKPDPDVAKSCNNMGVVLSDLGRYREALDYYEKALAIKISLSTEPSLELANAYLNRGTLFFELKKLQQTEADFEKAMEIIQQIPDNEELLLRMYNNFGALYSAKKDYYRSMQYHERSLEMRINLYGGQSPEVAQAYENLGATCMDLGNLPKALELTQHGLAIVEAQTPLDSTDLARNFSNMGNIYALLGDLSKALDFHRRALPILLAFRGADQYQVAEIRQNMASVLAQLGQFDEALEMYREARAVYINMAGPMGPDVQRTLINTALLYKDRGDIPNAVRTLDTVLQTIGWPDEVVINPDQRFNLLEALLFKGEVLASSNDSAALADARILLRQAVDWAERYRDELQSNDSKSEFTLLVRRALEDAIQVELKQPKKNSVELAAAYALAAKNKAFLLSSALRNADALNNLPDSLLHQESELRTDIAHFERLRYEMEQSDDPDDLPFARQCAARVLDLQRQQSALIARLEKQFPDYYQAKYNLNGTPVSYIQDSILVPGQAMLEYFVGDSNLYFFVVRKDTLIVRQIRCDRNKLSNWIEQFRQGIYGFYALPKSKRTDALLEKTMAQYLEYASLLYDTLIAPVKQWLPRNQKVILVPDGPLGYIPFDALLTAAPADPNAFNTYPFLFREYQFSYTYSATLLQEMRNKHRNRKPSGELVGFAPFSGDAASAAAETDAIADATRGGWARLIYSHDEVVKARQFMGGDIFTDSAASRTRFLQIAGQYRIIHLATHGVADNDSGDYAYLVFSDPADSTGIALVYVKDLYNLDLLADLVVLSACETGIGKLQRGEGIISLARAFAYSGARSIVTSLWSVSNRTTSALMVNFYDALKKEEKPVDEALRTAREHFFATASVEDCHPFFWAAFLPVGDMNALAPAK